MRVGTRTTFSVLISIVYWNFPGMCQQFHSVRTGAILDLEYRQKNVSMSALPMTGSIPPQMGSQFWRGGGDHFQPDLHPAGPPNPAIPLSKPAIQWARVEILGRRKRELGEEYGPREAAVNDRPSRNGLDESDLRGHL